MCDVIALLGLADYEVRVLVEVVHLLQVVQVGLVVALLGGAHGDRERAGEAEERGDDGGGGNN